MVPKRRLQFLSLDPSFTLAIFTPEVTTAVPWRRFRPSPSSCHRGDGGPGLRSHCAHNREDRDGHANGRHLLHLGPARGHSVAAVPAIFNYPPQQCARPAGRSAGAWRAKGGREEVTVWRRGERDGPARPAIGCGTYCRVIGLVGQCTTAAESRAAGEEVAAVGWPPRSGNSCWVLFCRDSFSSHRIGNGHKL